MNEYRVFIGYDRREAAAFYTCQQSIIEHCSEPMKLRFIPVTGDRRDGSNDFIYARFLIPYLCGYTGTAVFLDGDMLVRSDIADLFQESTAYCGVRVVKHDYQTKHPVKYLGYKNEDYPRKNWSSVILWNCGYYPNRVLDPAFVSSQSGSFLHRFQWLKDSEIGDLDPAWNKLVMEQELSSYDSLRHFTIGTPCFAEYTDCDGAEEWHQTYRRAIAPMK